MKYSELFQENEDKMLAAAEAYAWAMEAAPLEPQYQDVVSVACEYSDVYGEFVEANDATGRSKVYYFDPVWKQWFLAWFDSGLISVIIPGGALTVGVTRGLTARV